MNHNVAVSSLVLVIIILVNLVLTGVNLVPINIFSRKHDIILTDGFTNIVLTLINNFLTVSICTLLPLSVFLLQNSGETILNVLFSIYVFVILLVNFFLLPIAVQYYSAEKKEYESYKKLLLNRLKHSFIVLIAILSCIVVFYFSQNKSYRVSLLN